MLEAKIEALTAAVIALTAVMSNSKPAAVPAATPAKPAAKKPEAPALNKDGEAEGYAALKQPFLDLVKAVGRDPALVVIAPLKALNEIKAGEQTAGQYADLLAKIKAAMPSNDTGNTSLV